MHNSFGHLNTTGLLAQQLNSTLNPFRCPRQRETVIEDFERAVDHFLTRSSAAGLSAEKQDAVLVHIHRLLGATASPIRYSDRFVLACQILAHAAAPETVTSAGFSTSAAAALEYLIYLQEPQLIAELVAEIAISGQWQSPSGHVVKARRMNLLPVFGSGAEVEPPSSGRSYGSQIVQLALTNDMLSKQSEYFRYVLLKPAESAAMQGAVLEALYNDETFMEQFSGVEISLINREARTLLGRDVLVVHKNLVSIEEAIGLNNEVQFFDLLCDTRNPMLAAVLTETADVKIVAIKRFEASGGKLITFDPQQGGELRQAQFLHFFNAMCA